MIEPISIITKFIFCHILGKRENEIKKREIEEKRKIREFYFDFEIKIRLAQEEAYKMSLMLFPSQQYRDDEKRWSEAIGRQARYQSEQHKKFLEDYQREKNISKIVIDKMDSKYLSEVFRKTGDIINSK